MPSRSGRFGSSLVTALLLALAVTGSSAVRAQVFIQSFDATRDGYPSPIATLGLVTSPYFEDVRAAVTSRYGDAVVFGTPSWPSGVPAVTAEVLEEADIFVVTGATVILSQEEACLLDTFVEHGGAVLSFRNEWTLPTLLGVELGTFAGRGSASVVDWTSPIIAGRFGTVGSPVRLGMGTDYLPSGAGWPVLADAGRVMLVTFGVETGHLGRAVLAGDEEIFLNGPVPFGASLRGEMANNRLLFANIIDYLSGAPGLDADGIEALRACGDHDHDGSNGLEDCDDDSAAVFPGADELLDGRDNDCDGEIDEGLDGDGDGVPDLLDGCPETPADSAVDPTGCVVVCEAAEPEDPDEDGDGFAASVDCDDTDPGTHPAAVDLPGNVADEDCSGSAACDPSRAWRNHGKFVSCVSREVEQLIAAGLLSMEQGLELVAAAAQSDVGRDGQSHGDASRSQSRR